jgi:hypothetical protein
MVIIVRRPFTDFTASFLYFWAGSDEVKILKTKSPFVAAVPVDWSMGTSQKDMYSRT